jgi:Ca2+-binding RTX toxin-like protein
VTLIRLFYDGASTPMHALSGLNLPLDSLMDQIDAHSNNPWQLQEWLMNGNDTLNGGTSIFPDLFGGNGDDTFNAGNSGAYMQGGQGKDTYKGGTGFDTITFDDAYWDPAAFRGVVASLATGTAIDPWGNSETFSSIEELRGSQFSDRLTGSSADYEQFSGLGGRDIIDGGGGFDMVRYDRDANRGGDHGVTVDLQSGVAIDGFGKQDTLKFIEGVRGTDNADKLYGSSADNELRGFGGDDLLNGRGGADWLDGGSGVDTATYFDATAGVVVSLASPGKNTGFAKGDTFSSVENLTGSNFTDTLEGNGGANLLDGGLGSDKMTGGAGLDTFRLSTKLGGNLDTVTDFIVADDIIQLENAVFTALKSGALASAAFASNTGGTATSATHRIVYETDTGLVRYDADGAGGAAGIQIVKLTTDLAMTYEEFFIT